MDDPERLFNQIKQSDTDHEHTVTEYYAIAMALLNNFQRGRDVKWQNDPAGHFVNNLHNEIVVEMEKGGYKHHLGGASTDPFDQIGLMAVAYKHAIITENSITSTNKLITKELTHVHGLHIGVVPSLQSSAKRTITNYKESSYNLGCFGCGDANHA